MEELDEPSDVIAGFPKTMLSLGRKRVVADRSEASKELRLEELFICTASPKRSSVLLSENRVNICVSTFSVATDGGYL
jgi:hypothetical protein